jgi:hypothetical protein
MTKKMVCIVKADKDKFVKYHVNNLVKFTAFLDKEYPEWRFYNVFDQSTRLQVASFTKSRRPDTPRI